MLSLQNLTLGQYIDTRSVIHRLDPRIKCLTAFLLMVEIFFITQLSLFLLFILFCFGLARLGKLPAAVVLKNARPFVWLFGITFGVHFLFTQGRPLLTVPSIGIAMSYEGAINGLFFSLRLFSFILAAAVFTMTTSPLELTDALESIFKPLHRIRVPVHELAMIITISLRFVPTIIAEAERLRKAQLSRAVEFTGTLMKRIEMVKTFCVPLFLSAFQRADDLATAMDARCYRGSEGRTHYHELHLNLKDGCALALTGALCACLFILR